MWHLDQRELEATSRDQICCRHQEEEVEQRREELQQHRGDVQRREHKHCRINVVRQGQGGHRLRGDGGCVVSLARGHSCPIKLSLYIYMYDDNKLVSSFY